MQLKNNKEDFSVLVSGASGIVGYGILKSLREFNKSIKLVGTSIYENSIANSFCNIFELAPKTTDISYYPWLKEIIQKHKVDMLIPSIEVDVYSWNEHRKELESLGVKVLLNSDYLIKSCCDKWEFYQILVSKYPEYTIPTGIEYTSNIKFPMILKPRHGYASQGIARVKDFDELKKYKNKIGSELMIQPIIGDDEHEYTVSAFFDDKSVLCAYNVLKRKLSKLGYTETAETVSLDGIEKILQDMAGIFKPIGPTNFQFRKDNCGNLKLLEVNPRISSATHIRAAFGYNESEMSVRYFFRGDKISNPKQRKGKAFRYIEDMIYYEDSVYF